MSDSSTQFLTISPFTSGAHGTVSVPGSKSITNRCLLLSAFAEGVSVLEGALESDDAEVMQNALRDFGVQIKKDGKKWQIYGTGGKFGAGNRNIYLGNAGTAIRFLTAAAGYVSGETRFYGKERMHQRPIHELLSALKQIGVSAESEKNGCPPVIIRGTGIIQGGNCDISGQVSSQFLSALLQIAPLTQKGVRLKIAPPIVSKPYLDMTIALLEKYGAKTEQVSEYEYFLHPQSLNPVHIQIEADASSAAHVFSIALAAKGEITIENFPKKSIQGDAQYVHILEKFGAQIMFAEKGVTVRMKDNIHPLGEVNMEDMPDAALAAATLAALAKGTSQITGLSTLKKKECDRIEAVRNNLEKMGCVALSGKDFLEIHGNPDALHGAEIETYDDHRIAMSFAVLGTRVSGVKILNPKCVEKTFPDFWEVFESVRA